MKNISKLLIALLFITNISCENEPVAVADIDLVNEELLGYIKLISDEPEEKDFNCIEFNYSFTIFIYNEDLELDNALTVFNNTAFINILGNLTETQSISISYPITGTLNNGEEISITTNEELEEALKDCSKLNVQRQCNGSLNLCDWTVRDDETYNGDRLSLTPDGKMVLYHNTDVFKGLWVTLYIGDDLFINMNLNDDAAIEEFWNRNWNVINFSDDLITISNEGKTLTFQSNCEEICAAGLLEACELQDETGVASFDLSSYLKCIPVSGTEDPIKALQYTFYETESDAVNETNAIDAEAYTNIENPQIIYARIAYKTTNELIEIQTITINAVSCTDG